MVCLQNIRELYRPSSRALYWIKGTFYAPPLARYSTLAAGSPNHPGWSTFTLGHGARTVQVPLYAGTAAAPVTGSCGISTWPLTRAYVPNGKDWQYVVEKLDTQTKNETGG